jgi:hypothetical protein
MWRNNPNHPVLRRHGGNKIPRARWNEEGGVKLNTDVLEGLRMDCRRSQKVISDQGDTSPSQETSVCTQETSLPPGNAKKAIKPNPQPDLQEVSRSPYILQYAGFLFSSLQIKSFQPLLLESACAFILRAGSRTLST